MTATFIGMPRQGIAIGFLLIAAALSVPTISSADNKTFTGGASGYLAKAKQAEARHDFSDAISWFQKAADLGDAESMNELGWIYFGAYDIPGRQFKDYSRAAVWFQKAADLNYIPAITQLGVIYGSDGSFGLPADHAKAAQLFLKAAQAGNAQAMNNLGVMLSQGKGVRRDMSQAIHWWKKAMEADENGASGRAAASWLKFYDDKR